MWDILTGLHDELGHDGELSTTSFHCVEEIAILVPVRAGELALRCDHFELDHVICCHSLGYCVNSIIKCKEPQQTYVLCREK